MKDNQQSKLRRAIGKAVSFVTNNSDKVELVLDVLRIISTKSPDEVVQYSISMEYLTEGGKTFKLSLPKSKVKDSSEIQNVIATILAVSAEDIGATVEEVVSKVKEVREAVVEEQSIKKSK